MTGALALAIVLAPTVAIVLISLAPWRAVWAERLNLAASVIVFLAALALPATIGAAPQVFWDSYVVLDGLGAWSILCAAIVYLLASIYAVGYMRMLGKDERMPRFYALFAGFALTTLVGPMMNSAGVYWIAIELTTLVSTFLVAFEHAPESIEAAWKYIIVVSGGISLALLGTVLFYWAGSLVFGPSYAMTWAALRQAAPHANPALLELAFLLVLIGYGTKVGLAPMHTWLPDAHSEGPAPVSALLSGALLNTAMVGIVRYLSVVDAAQVGTLPRTILVVLGAVSLLVAALFIVRQRGIKRLMAYSSVEHMGVIALGFGFGGPLGVAGAMYHMLNHSLNKSLMFFGAGSAMRSYGTKNIGGIRLVGQKFPVFGALWLAGAVAITGAPPFGLFASELTILRAGLHASEAWAVLVMAVLLIVIFIGFLNHFRIMYFEPAGSEQAPERGISAWCVVPMWCALLPLLAFGLWWPDGLWSYFAGVTHSLSAVTQLAGGAMNGATLTDVPQDQLREMAEAVLHAGGRMQMVYALNDASGATELRYLSDTAEPRRFVVWRCRPKDDPPSLAMVWPLLGWYEREAADLFGLRFAGHPEPQPLVLQAANAPNGNGRRNLPDLDAEAVQQLPFGPVRADVLESAEFTFLYIGEQIIHYAPHLFLKHRGMEQRFEGCHLRGGVVLAERVSAVGSVAHALAYCQAVEAACGCTVPVRARWLRVLLAELERLYNHLHYLGHLSNTTTLKVGEAEGKLLEERAKQINARLTGSRFLRSLLVPGGLRRDLSPGDGLGDELERLRAQAARYAARLESSESHLDRLITTGVLPHKIAFDQGATGPVQRASGFDRDLRRDHPYAAYPDLPLTVPVSQEGDGHARQKVRIAEIDAALVLLQRVLLLLPNGPVYADCTPRPGAEGLGWSESPRGSLFYAVHLGPDGRLARVKIKSPSFSNWRVFPSTVHDTNMMDYAINEASFGLTVAGCAR